MAIATKSEGSVGQRLSGGGRGTVDGPSPCTDFLPGSEGREDDGSGLPATLMRCLGGVRPRTHDLVLERRRTPNTCFPPETAHEERGLPVGQVIRERVQEPS